MIKPHYSIQEVVAPAEEPCSIADLKSHLRVNIDDDDDVIEAYGKAARIACENRLGRKLITQTLALRFDKFPCSPRGIIELPYGPVVSVSSVQYLDTAGVQQTLSPTLYSFDIYSVNARLYPAYSAIWPTPQAQPNSLTITYVTGYGAAADVPENIKSALKLLTGTFYENRESTIVGTIVAKVPEAVEMLLDAERASWL